MRSHVSYAAKFTADGTITLTVQREADAADRDWVRLAVTDTGIGIPADKLDKLFEPFTQADASTTKEYGGTGLGLTITQRFVQMMGGEIDADSKEGEGSCFTIRVPAMVGTVDTPELKPAAAPKAPSPATSTPAATATRGTVLVVDDDAANRELLQRHLARDGFSVIVAEDGARGLELARQHHPDAITLDVMMPGMDGWAVLRALKADSATRDIPVIMVTMIDEKGLGYTLGATEYLTKPIDRQQLIGVLKRCCPRLTGGEVLVIEDDADLREMARRALESQGLSVREAGNGQEGLDALYAAAPSLVLLDLMMPVMDGFTFLLKMREQEAFRGIPVVVVTAKDLTPEERDLLSAGNAQILQKGQYTREQLLTQVRELVSKAVVGANREGKTGSENECF